MEFIDKHIKARFSKGAPNGQDSFANGPVSLTPPVLPQLEMGSTPGLGNSNPGGYDARLLQSLPRHFDGTHMSSFADTYPQEAQGYPHQHEHLIPDTTTSMLEGHDGRYVYRFGPGDIMKSQGELPANLPQQYHLEPQAAVNGMGTPAPAAHELQGTGNWPPNSQMHPVMLPAMSPVPNQRSPPQGTAEEAAKAAWTQSARNSPEEKPALKSSRRFLPSFKKKGAGQKSQAVPRPPTHLSAEMATPTPTAATPPTENPLPTPPPVGPDSPHPEPPTQNPPSQNPPSQNPPSQNGRRRLVAPAGRAVQYLVVQQRTSSAAPSASRAPLATSMSARHLPLVPPLSPASSLPPSSASFPHTSVPQRNLASRQNFVPQRNSVSLQTFVPPQSSVSQQNYIPPENSVPSQDLVLFQDSLPPQSVVPPQNYLFPTNSSRSTDPVPPADPAPPTDSISPADSVPPADRVRPADLVPPADSVPPANSLPVDSSSFTNSLPSVTSSSPLINSFLSIDSPARVASPPPPVAPSPALVTASSPPVIAPSPAPVIASSPPVIASPPSAPIQAPASLPQPTQEHADFRIRDFLESCGLTKPDPGLDWLGTLITWIAKNQQKHDVQIQEAKKEVQGQLEKTQNDLRQERERAEKLKSEIESKDTTISQLESYKELADEWKSKAEAANKKWETTDFELGTVNAKMEDLKKDNGKLARERENASSQIGNLSARVRNLNGQLDIIKANHASKVREIEGRHAVQVEAIETRNKNDVDAKLAAMKDHIAQLKGNHAIELAGKDDRIERLNADHRMALVAKDQHYLQLAEEERKKLAAKDQEITHITAVYNHELAARDANTTGLVNEYKRKMAEVQGSVNQKIDQATKKDHETIAKLKKQIASYNKDDYVLINDTSFTRSFEALVQDVIQLAAQIQQPATIDFDPSLDPTGCLDRNAGQIGWIWPRFVRSLCWSILLRGFFSLPFGFGALGSKGEGFRVLYPTYQATAQASPDDAAESTLAIPMDPRTTAGRVWLFDRMLAAVRSEAGTETEYRALFRANVNSVARELYNTLHHIINGQLDPSCFQLATAIAHNLGVLALEMGTQQARVVIESCQYGDGASPDEWKTEALGMSGASAQVDFMVHPCLSRVGDGRQELYKKKVIVKGQFVPIRMDY